LRNNANVKMITGGEGDYDKEVVTLDKAADAMRQANLFSLLYTSPSHTAAKPRWRVVCPTSRELPPEERTKIMARINGVLGGILSVESFTLSQAYFYGGLNGNSDHRVVIIPGDFVDLRSDLDAGASSTSAPSSNGMPTSKS
jgi:hypothetical protein